MRTLVVGAAIVDLMMKIDRLPKSGEDIPCRETKTVVGGCAYNVANTLRNLHCEHDLCVPVGTGSFADIIRRGMKEKGYEPVIEEPSEDNGYCLSLVEADGERTFITVQGAVTLVCVLGYMQILKWMGGNLPFMDSLTTVVSVVASFLYLLRFSEQWAMWAIVNALSIVMWIMVFMQGDSSALLIIIMKSINFINSTYGFLNWRKIAKENAQ